MLRRASASFLAMLLLGSLGVLAPARAAAPRADTPTRVDPAIRTSFVYLAQHGQVPPWFDARPNPERPAGMLPVLVRTKPTAATPALPALLRHAGLADAEVRALHGGVPLASGALSLLVTERGARQLAADPNVTRIALDLPARRLRPLDASRQETGTQTALRAMLAKNGTLLDGTGVTIADIDSGIYVHHPDFFRADAGTYPWIDVDGDGLFVAGTDGVDSDLDGAAEVARRLPGFGQSFYPPHVELLRLGSVLRPDVDFLYVDQNGNRERDFGAAFDESTPGYGEPLFVADDANGNGVLDVGERLVRLGSSKFRKIRTDRERVRGQTARGIGSWLAPENYADYTSHGTAVASVLAGGIWGHSKLLGLAPNAELLSYDYATKPALTQTDSVQWAIDESANVILTEYGVYSSMPLDGSTEEERLIDAAVASGIVVVNPAGNLVTGNKHQSVTVGASPSVVGLGTDSYFEGATSVIITVLERGPSHTFGFTLKLPSGETITLPDASTDPTALTPAIDYAVERSTTDRGTTMRSLYVYSGAQMPDGAYTLTIDLPDAPAGGVPLELYASDAVTAWGYGITFDAGTDAKTIAHPATADDGIAVAAYSLHDAPGYYNSSPAGALATYSSSGPRIDGANGIALAAPDNPLCAGVPEYGKPAGEAASYAPFGGTSGAGPHVAAAAALLRQAYPGETGAQLKARLLDHARPVDGPVERWGKGKLDVAAALDLQAASSEPPRDARIEIPADGLVVGRDNVVKLTVTDDGTAFRTRWDLDYDGTPDTEWIEGLETTLRADAPGARAIRVYVADAEGNVTGATLTTEILATPRIAANDDASTAKEDDGGCGCRTAGSPARSYGAGFTMLGAFAALIGARRPRSRRSRR